MPASESGQPRPDVKNELSFQGMSVHDVPKNYPLNQNVLIKTGSGKWEVRELAAPAKVVNEKFVVSVPDAAGNIKEIPLDYLPEIVTIGLGEDIEGYKVTEQVPTKNGKLEFNLRKGREVLYGVPQEILDALRRTAEIERQVETLVAEIRAKVGEAAKSLHERRSELEKEVLGLRQLLPSVSEAQSLRRAEIKRLEANFNVGFQKSEKLVKDLTEAVQAPDAPKLENVEAKTEYKHFRKTKAEKKKDEEAHETGKKTGVEQRKAQHEAAIVEAKKQYEMKKRVAAAIEERLNMELDSAAKVQEATDLQDKINQEFVTSERDWQEYDDLMATMNARPNGQRGTRPPAPKHFITRDVKLTDAEKRTAREKATKVILLNVYGELRDDPGTDGALLKAEIDRIRLEKAAHEPLRTRLRGNDYNNDEKEIENPLIFKRLVDEWKNLKFEEPKPPEEPKPAEGKGEEIPEGEVVFDFEEQFEGENGITANINKLVKRVTNDKGKAIGGLESFYETADNLKEDAAQMQKRCATLEGVVELLSKHDDRLSEHLTPTELRKMTVLLTVGTAEAKEQSLNELRLRIVESFKSKIKEQEESLDEIDRYGEINKAAEEADKKVKAKQEEVARAKVEAAAKAKEKPEVQSVDLPPELIREILVVRQDAVQEIMNDLYRGILDGKTDNAALEKFRNLFAGELSTNDRLKEQLKKKLALHGVKNWEKFQVIWKEKIADVVAAAMKAQAEATVKKEVAEAMTTLGTTLEKAWNIKGQIATRIVTTMVLVGGATAATAAVMSTGGLAGLGAVAVSGAAAGGVRGWINRKLFGRQAAVEKNQKMIAEMEEKKKNEIIVKTMDRQFNQNAGEGFAMFTDVLAQALREESTKAETKEETGIAEVDALSANGRRLYEQALMNLETHTEDEKVKRELAVAISRLTTEGDKLAEESVKSLSPQVVDALNSVLNVYSGKGDNKWKAYGGAMVSGAAIGVLLNSIRSLENVDFLGGAFDANDLARGTMGAVFGAIAGVKWAEGKRQREEREQARMELTSRMAKVKNAIGVVRVTGTAPAAIREDYVALKKLLHGTASPAELSAVVFVDKDATGKTVGLPDQLLLKQIESIVFEAERAGMSYESRDQKKQLDAVLGKLRSDGDKLESKTPTPKGLAAWAKRNGIRVVGAVGGAVIGALTAIAIGNTVAPAMKEGAAWVDEKTGLSDAMHTAGVKLGILEDAELRAANEAMMREQLGDSHEEQPGRYVDYQVIPESDVDLDGPKQIGEIFDITTGKQSNSLLDAANFYQKEHSGEILDSLKSTHPEWVEKGLTNEQMLHRWRVEQVHDFGSKFNGDGTETATRTLHAGDQIKLVVDENGPHLVAAKADGSEIETHKPIIIGEQKQELLKDDGELVDKKLVDKWMLQDKYGASTVEAVPGGAVRIAGSSLERGLFDNDTNTQNEVYLQTGKDGQYLYVKSPNGEIYKVDAAQTKGLLQDAYKGTSVEQGGPVDNAAIERAEFGRIAKGGTLLDTLPKGLGAKTGVAVGKDGLAYEYWVKPTGGENVVYVKTNTGTVIQTTLESLKGNNVPTVDAKGGIANVSAAKGSSEGGAPTGDAVKPPQAEVIPFRASTSIWEKSERLIDESGALNAGQKTDLKNIFYLLDERVGILGDKGQHVPSFLERHGLTHEPGVKEEMQTAVKDSVQVRRGAYEMLNRGRSYSDIREFVFGQDKLSDVQTVLGETGGRGVLPEVLDVNDLRDSHEGALEDAIMKRLHDAEAAGTEEVAKAS